MDIDSRKAAPSPGCRVALIAAPWHLHGRPSIQLGCLKAFLEKSDARIRVDCHHPYLHLAAGLGLPLYDKIAANMWLSEALFAPLLFPDKKSSAAILAANEAKKERIAPFSPPEITERIDTLCAVWSETVDWSSFDLIGFSVCFHQLLASLLLVRLIKTLSPKSRIVFGGSSILAGMAEPLRDLADVDYCICGEGELPLLTLCRQILAEKGALADKTVTAAAPACSEAAISSSYDRAQVADLDVLPVPDYRDYFSETAAIHGRAPLSVTLPVEFSRGCWWSKCAFCNLNLQWRGYRNKSARRMREEISFLAARHQLLDFSFTDNCLPLRESRKFFERMEKEKRDVLFFAELRQEQAASFSLYRRGGLRDVQVGIEALSSGLLAAMGKGGRTIDNIYAMKMAVECGIRLQGNIIVDFPGSTEQQRDETLRNLDYVFPYHPMQCASFFLGHSSPVHRNPKNFHIRSVTAHPKFTALLPARLLDRLPMLICGYRGDRTVQKRLWQPVRRKIEAWGRYHKKRVGSASERPLLEYRDGGEFLLIRQECQDGNILRHRLTGTSRALYLCCEAPASFERICRQFPALARTKVSSFLDELERKRLVFKEHDRYLALAVRRGRA